MFERLVYFMTGVGSNQVENISSASNAPLLVASRCSRLRLDT